MKKVSSKYISLLAVESLLDYIKDNQNSGLTSDGILLLTSFGFVYGKIKITTDDNSQKTVSDILINSKTNILKEYEEDEFEVINDGSVIILENAVVKYPANNYTINMAEIIIFSDQVIGYYPIDLSTFENQFPQQ
ncbi:MAG: hypothetical protein E7206_17700 [Clostridium beijerinckii]|nr:hypothetical protein [Clostridium beijerinckii]